MKRSSIVLLYFLLGIFCSNAQSYIDSISIDNEIRTFRVFVPEAIQGQTNLPIVLNFHGYGSNATQQEVYSRMNEVADTSGFVVIYPEGIDNAWNVGFGNNTSDVEFISQLIDKLYLDHQIDISRVYSCGMSNGGYFSYRLACELPEKITAFVSVTGSMTIDMISDCTTDAKKPFMQMHGTADSTVLYNGDNFSAAVETAVEFWATKNGCNPSNPIISAIPDINQTDGCTAEKIAYPGCNAPSILIKIDGGGHTWPDGLFTIGVTNRDFNASEEIWKFFQQFDSDVPLNLNSAAAADNIIVTKYNNKIDIRSSERIELLELIDLNSRTLLQTDSEQNSVTVDLNHLQQGLYLIKIKTSAGSFVKKLMLSSSY